MTQVIYYHPNSLYYFDSEYAAYSDRMYMTKNDDWSRVIEGSHLLMCGIFALLGLYFKSKS